MTVGLDDGDLLFQPEWDADADLVSAWRTVFDLAHLFQGRAALDDVGDVDVLAEHPRFTQALVEELAGASDEGEAGRILIGTGAFADQHQGAVRVAVAEYDLGAGLRQVAGGARGGLPGEGEDLARFVAQSFFRHVLCSF